ncbi:MaoC/PaaZ C-terminal domain-containing protein [Isosphaeraceae bacterium EP7]
MSRRSITALRFQDLAVGDEWESPARTITQADVAAFAGLSGDYNPLHMDHEAAAAGPFGAPVAHGLLGLAVSSGLASNAPRVETLAFLCVIRWEFLRPIRFNDTVHVLTRVEALESRARGRRGLVTWRRQVIDQAGQVLQDGTIQTLVRGRDAVEPESGE